MVLRGPRSFRSNRYYNLHSERARYLGTYKTRLLPDERLFTNSLGQKLVRQQKHSLRSWHIDALGLRVGQSRMYWVPPKTEFYHDFEPSLVTMYKFRVSGFLAMSTPFETSTSGIFIDSWSFCNNSDWTLQLISRRRRVQCG